VDASHTALHTHRDVGAVAAARAATSLETSGRRALRLWNEYAQRYALDLAPAALGQIGAARNAAFAIELGRFITYVAETKPLISGSSASQYAAHVAATYRRFGGVILRGVGDFGAAIAKYYTSAKPTKAGLHRTPIPLDVMARFLACDPKSSFGAHAQVAGALAFGGNMRLGEITGEARASDNPHQLRHLRWAVEGGALVGCTLHLRFTKSSGPADVSVGARGPIRIHAGQVHMRQGCPVGLLVQLVRATLRTAGNTVDRVTELVAASIESSLPLYPPQVVRSGRPPRQVSSADVVTLVRSLAQGEQDSSGWKGHSFRITSTTTMVRLGIEHGIIQRLGRWVSAKSMNSYIRKEGDGLPPLDIGWGHLELQRAPQ